MCDFAHGAGEVMKAAINCKVSEAATSTGVRVACWGQDPRKVFSEVGQAVGRTELSKLYVSGRLVIPGHQPVPDPGNRPERSRKVIKALLSEPLKNLSLDSEGNLIIPSQEEIAKACPVTLNEEQERDFASWRIEFLRHAAVGANAEEDENPAKRHRGDNGRTVKSTLAPGTQAGSAETMTSEFGDEILTQKPLPNSGIAATREITLCLTEVPAADGAQKVWRVWLHNKASKNVVLQANTYLGQGGPGKFQSLVLHNLLEHQKDFAWRFTRITAYKKDNAELANGYMIFNKGTTPLEGKPKLMLLADVEADLGNNVTLYGHAITRGGSKVTITPSPSSVVWLPLAVDGSQQADGGEGGGFGVAQFEAANLGQFLRSHEDTTTSVPKCKGLVRPVFEMRIQQPQQGQQPQPVGHALQPHAGRSAVWIMTVKKIEIPAKGFVLLG